MNEAPILLQRGCRLEYRLRVEGAPEPVPPQTSDGEPVAEPISFFIAASCAQSLQRQHDGARVWLDLFCLYEPQAMNEEARVHISKTSRADRREKRLATWEVFPEDVVLCPAGQRKLDPKLHALAVAVQQPQGEATA